MKLRMVASRCCCVDDDDDVVITWNSGMEYDHLVTNTSTAFGNIMGTGAAFPDLSASSSAGSTAEMVNNSAAWWFGTSLSSSVTSAVWNTSVRAFKTNPTDTSNRDAEFTLYGVDHDNFTTGSTGTSSQWWDMVAIKTTASVTLASVATASTPHEVATSIDVTSIVNEIVSRPGWSSGNNIVFILVDNSEYEKVGFVSYGCGHLVRLFQTTLTITP